MKLALRTCLVLTLVFATILSFAACGNNRDTSNTQEKTTESTTKSQSTESDITLPANTEDKLQLVGKTVHIKCKSTQNSWYEDGHLVTSSAMDGVVEAYNDSLIKIRENDTNKVYCIPISEINRIDVVS